MAERRNLDKLLPIETRMPVKMRLVSLSLVTENVAHGLLMWAGGIPSPRETATNNTTTNDWIVLSVHVERRGPNAVVTETERTFIPSPHCAVKLAAVPGAHIELIASPSHRVKDISRINK